MRRYLVLIAVSLFLTLPLLAAQIDETSTDVRGKYEGYFYWEGMEEVRSPLLFTFTDQTKALDGGFDVIGTGQYLDTTPPIRIKLRAHYQPDTGAIEIWESSPDSNAEIFETNGSHVGTFKAGTIQARWTTSGRGDRGVLSLKRTSR